MRALAAVVLVAACSKAAPAVPPPPVEEAPRPVASHWQGEVLHLDEFDAELSVKCCVGDPAKTRVQLKGWRDGSKLTVGATSWEKTGDSHQVDVTAYLGALDLEGKQSEVALGIPVKASIPGPWLPVETVVPPVKLRKEYAQMVLKEIVSRPLPFAIDVADDTPDTAYVVDLIRPPMLPTRGDGKQLADVDWVAVATWTPTGQQKKCGGYSRTPGIAGNESVEIGFNDIVLAVYDRRSGKKLGEKTFASQTSCPKYAQAGGTGIGPDEKPILAWLDARLAAGKVE